MKYLANISIIILISVNNLFSQENKKEWERANWGLGYSFGIPDGSSRTYFNNMQLLKVQKNFNVSKAISLYLLGNMGHTNSKISSNINFASLGGGAALYPLYLASLISGKEYHPAQDNLHIDFGFQALLNRADFDYLYHIGLNLYTLKFKNRHSLSAKISYDILLSDDEINKNPIYKDIKFNSAGFFAIGINYGF